MKSSYINIILCVGLIMSAFCSVSCSESPKDTAKKAAEAIQTDDWKTFYSLLSSEDKELKTENQVKQIYRGEGYEAEVPEIFPEVIKELKVKDFKAKVENDTAKVTYVREVLDLDAVMKACLDFNDLMEVQGNKKVRSLSTLPDPIKEKMGNYLRKNDIPKKEEEKSLKLIKEDGKWRVFCNFAFPQRLKEAKEEIKKYFKVYDYLGAKNFILSFNERYDVDEFQDEMKEINQWNASVVTIGQSVTIGSLEFTPIAIEIRKVAFTGNTYSGDPLQTESSYPYMVLQYRVKNVSKAQTFAPRDVRYDSDHTYTWVTDSNNNRMNVATVPGNPNGNIDQEISKPLAPGQEIVYHAVVSTPVNEEAQAYLWSVRLRVNNAANAYEDIFHVRILKSDIPF